ncbi:MAG: calcium-binding protein [Inquilinus sp.]|uniref:calcium-binding protein n=1 Tax=Inquilinus sp. TaxID=1932117 RepID=UPI003F3E0780
MAVIFGSEDFDRLTGDSSNDAFFGLGGDDDLTGLGGNDALFGDEGDDKLDAGDGNDFVHGGVGDDDILGGTGIDQLEGQRGSDSIDGGDGDDLIQGQAGDDLIDGGSDADRLDGGDGADTLTGGEGTDILIGGAGIDAIDGGAGADILVGEVQPATGTPPLGQFAADGFIWAALDGADDDRILDFFPGVDVLALHFCSEFATVQALLATIGGNAVLSVSRGGGVATLTLEGVAASAITARELFLVDGSPSAEAVSGGAAADDLFGRFGNDVLDGAAGSDRLFGEQDDDTLDGGLGDDRLFGGSGNDILRGGAGADRLDGGAGVDLASYFTGTTGVAVNLAVGTGGGGQAQGDTLAGIENLSGSQGNDSLVGSSGANVLQGWNGGDVLTGAGGQDMLTGGAGADRFVYGSAEQSVVGAAADRIVDFSRVQGDRIDLAAIDANTAAAGNQAFAFIGSALHHKIAGELRFVVAGGVTTIAGDVNGDGTSDFHIALTGDVALQASDFAL